MCGEENGHQWRIQFFSWGGGANSKSGYANRNFCRKCMKMKEFGPPGEGAFLAPPLDPPMDTNERY